MFAIFATTHPSPQRHGQKLKQNTRSRDMKINRKLAKVKKNAEVAAKLADLRAALKVTRGDLVSWPAWSYHV